MGKRTAAAAIALAVVAIFLCATAFAGYRTEFGRATKNQRLFDFETWDARIIWHATFFSDKFRSAFDERHLEVNHLTSEDAAPFLEDEKYRQENGWDFFIGFYTKKDYKKFSMDSDSFWEIYLTTASGEKVRPVSIDIIPITPYEKVMYKYLTHWSKAYRVTFPKVALGGEFSLTIESVIGESTMKWKNK